MLEIVLASSNPGKMQEIRDLTRDLPVELISQSELGVNDAEETGLTFVENAILKARHASKITGLPALADDSGMCVDALMGKPGVFSARYAGPNATDADRINKVLNELSQMDDPEMTAAFHCVLALVEHENDPAPLICHGIWEGEITLEPRGEFGFGYDPIFYVPEHKCTAAELDPVIKNSISHRGQAMTEFVSIMAECLAV